MGHFSDAQLGLTASDFERDEPGRAAVDLTTHPAMTAPRVTHNLTPGQHVLYKGRPAIVQQVYPLKATIKSWQMNSPAAPGQHLSEFDLYTDLYNLHPATWEGDIQFVKLHVVKGTSTDGSVWKNTRYGRVEKAHATVLAENTATGEVAHVGDTDQRIDWLKLKIITAAHHIATQAGLAQQGCIIAAIEWHDEPPAWLFA